MNAATKQIGDCFDKISGDFLKDPSCRPKRGSDYAAKVQQVMGHFWCWMQINHDPALLDNQFHRVLLRKYLTLLGDKIQEFIEWCGGV